MLPWIIGLILLLIVLAMVLVAFIKAFYRKVDQGRALIVNTMKSKPTVTFTGCTVIPVIHRAEVMDISVKTIEVDRRGKDGLICFDNIRADISVTFFVRINKTEEAVLEVASAVGVDRASDQRTLEALFLAKFSEALKTVGKQMDFTELYNERQKFKGAIIQVIDKDLNGYFLEDVAIDYLEQTPLESLDPDNILDAQGRKKIIELTATERVKANQIERDAQKTIKKQDVEAREAILALERQEEEAVAIQHRDVEVVRAREMAEVQKVQFEEHRRSEEAKIQAEQELGIARENSQREVEVANQNRQRAVLVEQERVQKERELEVINRERATELSRIEKEKALEIEKKLIADVVRERVAVEKNVAQEEERIKDLRATMEATRHKQVALTKAEQEADMFKIRTVTAAEAAETAAGHNAKEKLVLAEADQAAAEKQALAEMRRAEGVQAKEAALGLAQAKVKEADAVATEKLGLANVRIQEAEVKVIASRGQAEASMIKDKGTAEASAIGEKAEAMKLLNDSTREHEEFRLRLEKELEIEKAAISANISIAERNADILGRALSGARFDIVGGDGAFFDRFVKAVSVGKSIDGALDRSTALQTATKEYLQDGRSLPDDLKDVLANSKLGSDDLKNLATAGLLAKLAKGKDGTQIQALIDKARELGFGDQVDGWLAGSK